MGAPGERAEYFAISTGRCGSTLLSDICRLHEDVLSLSEFFYTLRLPAGALSVQLTGAELWHRMSRIDPDFRQVLEQASIDEVILDLARVDLTVLSPLMLVSLPHVSQRPEQLLEELRREVSQYPRGVAAAHFSRLFGRLAALQGRRIWIERSGASIEHADELVKFWPRGGFIFLVRDGRDCAVSMARHPLFRVHMARLLRKDPNLDVRACLDVELPIHRFGAYWSALMLRTKRLLEGLAPEQVLLLRYEELVAAPVAQLERLAGFMRLNGAAAWIEEAAKLVRPARPRWQTLAPSERTALERACRPGMQALEQMATA